MPRTSQQTDGDTTISSYHPRNPGFRPSRNKSENNDSNPFDSSVEIARTPHARRSSSSGAGGKSARTKISNGTGVVSNEEATEATGIMGSSTSAGVEIARNYNTVSTAQEPPRQSTARSRKGGTRSAEDARERQADSDRSPTRWKKLAEKWGSVELENKGSVARDHLALERTFLAWLRTSLSFSSIGIAITQLFRLNTSLSSTAPTAGQLRLQRLGSPLGASFIAIGIVVLILGFHRYFESQHYVIRGKFPASRGSIVVVSLIAGALIVASFIVILVVNANSSHTA